MADQEDLPQTKFRPEPDEVAAAQAVLSLRKQTMSDFLRACLRGLDRDPEAMLSAVQEHWPEPRRVGRPPKEVAVPEDEEDEGAE